MEEKKIRPITLAGVTFPVAFQSLETWFLYFREFWGGLPGGEPPISVSMEEIQREKESMGSESFTEFNLLLGRFSARLLPHDRCAFHGVAVAVGNRAWLITAPSGTGKSTQFLLWKELLGDRVRLICGDKPILEFQPGGEILVHPSPWIGKERWGGGAPAKLAGIVYLEQGPHNTISPMPVSKAVVPLYTQFLYHPADEGELRRVSAMLQKLLEGVPVWKLVNLGDADSARLTHETLGIE